ncbi:MAG: TPM domain-containing protein [Acidobacteriaceae bacterium]
MVHNNTASVRTGRGLRGDFRVLLLLLFAASSAWGQGTTSLPKRAGYVSDFAHVMSAKTIGRLDALCGEIERRTHDRIDVVTVTSTDGEPIEQYANALQEAWRQGDREAMVMVAVGQRQRWIAAESGLAQALPPAEIEKISGQMVPMLRNNDFDGAMMLAVNELGARMAASAGVRMHLETPWGAPASVPAEYRWIRPVTWGLTILLFASLAVWAYTSEIGDSLRRRLGKRMRRERP